MSEEDKQRRRMQAAQKRRQARDLEKQCTIIQGKKAELEAKIEKLEKAKQEITTALTSVSGFSKGLSSLKDTGSGSFKGDRKDKFDKKVGDVQKVLTTFKKGHKANKSKIDEKIQKLKENLQRVSMSIGTLDVRIGSLDAAAAQLES
jgi:prefoldin subunit 5